jgi:hypothetical protein
MNRRWALRALSCTLAWGIVTMPGVRPAAGAEIRLGVEVEFRCWYRDSVEPATSFQLREAKLLLDTFISPHASALLEFEMEPGEEATRVERGFFLWRPQEGRTRVKLGQFRLPFGYWDAFTIDRSLTKNTLVGAEPGRGDSAGTRFGGFKLRRHDVGVQLEHRWSGLHCTVAVVNGSSIDSFQDDNDRKDLVGSVGFQKGRLSVHLNAYRGWQGADRLRDVEVIGGDLLYSRGRLTFGGEVIPRLRVGEVRAGGAYVQLIYDMIDVLYGSRLVAKLEKWDPDTERDGDDVLETIVGFKQTLTRGMTLQVEYQGFTRQSAEHHDGILLEIELEL